MRRKDKELFGADIEVILEKGEYGVLSTVGPDGTPYGIPLSYVASTTHGQRFKKVYRVR